MYECFSLNFSCMQVINCFTNHLHWGILVMYWVFKCKIYKIFNFKLLSSPFLSSNYLIVFPLTEVVPEAIEIPNVHLQSDEVSFKIFI